MSASRQYESAQHRQRVERRRRVAALRLAGQREQSAIARELGVQQSTISRDLAALDRLYLEQARVDTALAKGLELERLDALLQAVWPQATQGQLGAVDRVLAIMERRAKLLGLDAPQRVDNEQRIRRVAVSYGLDPDAAVAEARRIIQEGRRAGGG